MLDPRSCGSAFSGLRVRSRDLDVWLGFQICAAEVDPDIQVRYSWGTM